MRLIFFWGYLESLFYADEPEIIDALKINITRVIDEIRPELLEEVVQNYDAQMRFFRTSSGGHMSTAGFIKQIS